MRHFRRQQKSSFAASIDPRSVIWVRSMAGEGEGLPHFSRQAQWGNFAGCNSRGSELFTLGKRISVTVLGFYSSDLSRDRDFASIEGAGRTTALS